MKDISGIRTELKSDGFSTIADFFNAGEIDTAFSTLKTMPASIKHQFTEEAWGYGDVSEIYPFNKLKGSEFLSLISQITEVDMAFNHVLINRKSAWIGPEVEYHQEVLNRGTFAAGAPIERLQNEWLQFYSPLQNENAHNGGLRILSNSHKLGVLDYDDIISPHFSHKRRVKPSVLDKIYNETCDLIDLNLKAGTLLIFSPLLIHSSPSNGSPMDRVSMVAQARPKDFEHDQEIFRKETNYRKKFAIEHSEHQAAVIREKLDYTLFKKNG